MSQVVRVIGLLALLALLCPTLVRAQNGRNGRDAQRAEVPVEVVDVAGGRAYVRPGESAGVRRGSVVVIRKRP